MNKSLDTPLRSVFYFCLAASLLPAAITFAARGYSKGGKYEPPSVVVPDVDPKAAQQAQSDAAAARAERKKAEDNLASVVARLKDDFEKSPEMSKALADLKSAQSAYDSTVKPIAASVRETTDYKTAIAAKLAAESKISDLHATAGNDAQISQLAMEAMKQSAAGTKLENDAIRNDPAATEAKKKLAAAGLAAGKLRAVFNASLTKNKDWLAARKALDDAIQKSQLADANSQQESQKFAAALAAHNAAEAQRASLDRTHPQTSEQTKPAPADKPTDKKKADN